MPSCRFRASLAVNIRILAWMLGIQIRCVVRLEQERSYEAVCTGWVEYIRS